MRRLSVILLVLACVGVVTLAVPNAQAYREIDANEYLTPFLGSTTGACSVQIEQCTNTNNGPPWNRDLRLCNAPSAGYWPSNGQCPSIDAVGERAVGGELTRHIEPTTTPTTTFLSDSRAVLYGMTPSAARTSLYANSLWNKPAASGATTLFSFGWCGEDVLAVYQSNTMTASSVTFHSDDDPLECHNFYQPVTGIIGQPDWFYTTRTIKGGNALFTLPSPLSCTGYSIQITDRSHGDWPAIGTQAMAYFPGQQGAGQFSKKYVIPSDRGDNSLTVTLDVNSRNQTTKITVDSQDRSSAAGGVAFSILCDGIQEPDQVKTVCVAPWAWDDAVHAAAPGNACCGDDSGDTNTLIAIASGQKQCVNTGTDFQWTSTITVFGGVTCDATTEGNVYHDGSKAALCFKDGNTHRFTFANGDTLIRDTQNGKFVSDGTSWLTCGNTASATAMGTPGAGASATNALQVSAGVAAICSLVKNANDVNNPEYVCANGWQANTAALPTFTPVPGATPPAYQVTTANTASSYFVCQNGALTTAQAKWSPARTQSGPCTADTCYYPGADQFSPSECVPSGKWVRDDYCLNGAWTTRTRLLADDMLKTFPAASIVHCDSASEALNTPKVPAAFAAVTPTPRLNSICVAQENTASGAVVVGATLNNVAGRNFGDSYDEATDQESITIDTTTTVGKLTFAKALNHTKLTLVGNACDEANTWLEADEYLNCPASAGQVLYNTDTDTVVFATNTNTQFVNALTSEQVAAQRFASVGQPTMPLSGNKVYSYTNTNNNKAIDAVLQKEGTGANAKYQATIVYTGFNPTNHVTSRITNAQRVSITQAGSAWIVTLTTPTQGEWEYLTLQLRP
jgi:hypothetical protein